MNRFVGYFRMTPYRPVGSDRRVVLLGFTFPTVQFTPLMSAFDMIVMKATLPM